MAEPIGLKFNEDRNVISNTIMSHLLTEYAEIHGGASKQKEVGDLLLTAFWGDGTPLSQEFVLKVASDMGFDVQDVERYITDPKEEENLIKKVDAWKQKELSGVPYFIMNGRPVFSGSQEPDVFKNAILKIGEKYPLEEDTKSNL